MEHGIVYSFKDEQMRLGTHDFTTDNLKIALYDENTDLTLSGTSAYTTDNEFLSGGGYSAGGISISLASGYPKLNTDASSDIPVGSVMLFDFDDITITNITGSARGALIYNIDKGNKAVAMIDFGYTLTFTNQDLVITWPNPDNSTAIIRVV